MPPKKQKLASSENIPLPSSFTSPALVDPSSKSTATTSTPKPKRCRSDEGVVDRSEIEKPSEAGKASAATDDDQKDTKVLPHECSGGATSVVNSKKLFPFIYGNYRYNA
jgi:hypothetical protein